MSRRIVLDHLSTCPIEICVLYVGDCRKCRRPMIPNRRFRPVHARWFVRANSTEVCRACQAKIREARTGDTRAARRARQRPPAPAPDLILRLRAAVGACLACGWAYQAPEGDDPGSGPHPCDVDVHELEETA